MIRAFLIGLLCFATAFFNGPTATAALISAEEAIGAKTELSHQLLNELDKTETQERVKALGLSVDEARERIAGLSEAELRSLMGSSEAQQAGGDIAISLTTVLLIILIVLLLR